jgi:hypothetical protein
VQSFEKNISQATVSKLQSARDKKRVACDPLAALMGIRSERSTCELRKRVLDLMLELQETV